MPRNKGNSGKAPASQATSRYSGLAASRQQEAPTFVSVVGDQLGRALDLVTSNGDAILIARTSDGGAVALTLLEGDDRHKLYATSQDELDRIFEELSG